MKVLLWFEPCRRKCCPLLGDELSAWVRKGRNDRPWHPFGSVFGAERTGPLESDVIERQLAYVDHGSVCRA